MLHYPPVIGAAFLAVFLRSHIFSCRAFIYSGVSFIVVISKRNISSVQHIYNLFKKMKALMFVLQPCLLKMEFKFTVSIHLR